MNAEFVYFQNFYSLPSSYQQIMAEVWIVANLCVRSTDSLLLHVRNGAV